MFYLCYVLPLVPDRMRKFTHGMSAVLLCQSSLNGSKLLIVGHTCHVMHLTDVTLMRISSRRFMTLNVDGHCFLAVFFMERVQERKFTSIAAELFWR